MHEDIKTFVKDELIALSNGEYSDYRVNGLFKALKGFDANAELLRWAHETSRKVNSDGSVPYTPEGISFMPWLVQSGFVEDVDYRELPLGCYGEIFITEEDT